MADSLEERVRYILDDSDFNDLPYEERKRIIKYTLEQQILTIFQTLNQHQDLTTAAWKRKQRTWLKNCVDRYYREYRYPEEKKNGTS